MISQDWAIDKRKGVAMKAQSHLTLICLCVTLLTATALLVGCVMPYSYSSGSTIKASTVKKIRDGKTIKQEVIQWFGVPTNVVRPQAEAAPSLLEVILPGLGDSSVSSRTYAELFSGHNLTENHRVYVYTATRTEGTMVQIGPVMTSDAHAYSDTLLVLIDEGTGIVADHIFKKDQR